jgi:hypothetical protein
MNLQRIVPPIYLYTPLGAAEAHWIQVPKDADSYVYFICFMMETKECWAWPNTMIRMAESVSAVRAANHSEIRVKDDMLETLRPHIMRHKGSPLYDAIK